MFTYEQALKEYQEKKLVFRVPGNFYWSVMMVVSVLKGWNMAFYVFLVLLTISSCSMVVKRKIFQP